MIAIFLILLIISTIYGDENVEDYKKPNSGFIVALPKALQSGKNETICLSIHSTAINSLSIKIIIDLKIKDQHYYTIKNLQTTEYVCFELYVPHLELLNEPRFASIKVQLQINDTVIYSAHNQDPIIIYPNKELVFIETDRRTYKPGDVLKFRVLVLNENLLPAKQYKINMIRIRNPVDITVAIWENITTELGLVQLEHQLPQEAIKGKWRIDVNDGTHHPFEINRYILPRFQVELHHPKVVYYESDRLKIEVCAKYTYGGNVKGSTFIRLTDTHHILKQSIQMIKPTINGCTKFEFTSIDLNFDEFKNRFSTSSLLSQESTKVQFFVTTTVTEYGTDKIEMKTGKIIITFKAYQLKFDTIDKIFMPGIPYYSQIFITNLQIPTIIDEVVQICYNLAIRKSWNLLNNEQCTNFTLTNNHEKDGVIKFVIPALRSNVIHLHLNTRSLNRTNIADNLLVIRLHSTNQDFIRIEQPKIKFECRSLQQLKIYFTTNNFHENQTITFYYLIKSRGQIIKLHKYQHQVQKKMRISFDEYENSTIIGKHHRHTMKTMSTIDEFTLKFKLDDKILTNYQFLIYYITNDGGETIVATREIQIESCLNNRVVAKWAMKQSYPGSSVALLIGTTSDSLCSITAIDKATQFMDNLNRLDTFKLMRTFMIDEQLQKQYESLLTQSSSSGRRSCLPPIKKNKDQISSLMIDDVVGGIELERSKRYIYSFSEDFDAYDVVNKFGANIITNLKIITKPCYTGPAMPPPPPSSMIAESLTDQYIDHNDDRIVPIRSYFPETWLWELVPVRGAEIIHRDLPHSITDWITNIMCISEEQGVGFSQTTQISSFQPFYIDVLTPYSIKKDEILYLHVIVFNYVTHNLPIRLSLSESSGLELLNRRRVAFCISTNDTLTHVFELKATEIGVKNITVLGEIDSSYPGECGPDVLLNRRDVVFKTFLVDPEGYPMKQTKSVFLCGGDVDNQSNSIEWLLELIDNDNDIVPETNQLKIIINGDLLGQTIENLEQLLQIPTGCGEQIMATLAPNLYIYNYLQATGQLTTTIRQRIVRNLKIGYQRILNYLHRDGSFSAFGFHDPSGSMFLTVFVVRVLQQAKQLIYVDQKLIDRAVNWIFEHQLENGCFNSMLHVFQDMGLTSIENSTASLTSYVIISLLEAGINIPERIRTNAKYCIRGHYHLDKYTLAISSYALFKINWYDEAVRMLKKLEQISNQQDNLLWWSTKNTSATTDIEITSYVLLALLEYKTQENLAKAHSIVRWLTTKQGPKGGFRSTQDTVVALDALTKYSTFINSRQLNLNVTIQTKKQTNRFNIKSSDRLKSKHFNIKHELSDKNSVKVNVDGDGCILAQLIQTYYLKQQRRQQQQVNNSNNVFKLNTELTSVSNIDQCSIVQFTSCLTYDGPDQQANMAILEIELPSGYKADRGSLYRLIDQTENSKLKMFEEINDKVILYFTKLNHDDDTTCISFNINENNVIAQRQESTIKLYDYYKPEYEIVQLYKTNDDCNRTFYNLATIPELVVNDQQSLNNNEKIISKRWVNPDFVDRDINLQEPEGNEGANREVWIKTNYSNRHSWKTSLGNLVDKDDILHYQDKDDDNMDFL